MEKINNYKTPVGEPTKLNLVIRSNGPTLNVTLPKKIAMANGWKSGDFVTVWVKKLNWEE